ncbi:MAG: TetR/AcrR family transcriptional regulator [Betaproteobacteria bacterium]|nr:TetR/AcrR family transcriptional regulator [Betaproteobacteria bacterium]
MPNSLANPFNVDPAHKRERRKEARPVELLDAALSLFVEKGFAATKVEEVALRAGVSKGTLFLYFSSKQDLFKAVIRANLADHFPAWNQEFSSFEGSTSDMLRHAMQSWWERIGNTKASGITKLVTSEAHNFPEVVQFYESEVMQPGQKLFKAILQRGIDNGEFKPLPTEVAVFSLVSTILFLTMWKHSLCECLSQQSLDPVEFLNLHVDTLIQGWRAPAG